MKTIKSSSDISRIFDGGRRINTPGFTVLVMRNEEQHDQPGRVAFIAGKKNGNAVWRNKAKRRMRALYRDLDICFPDLDIVMVARRQINEMSYLELKQDLSKVIHKIHCL